MSLDRIIKAASDTTRKAGHSELYEWLWARFDDLAPSLLPPRTPNWNRIAQEFATLAIQGEAVRDGSGKAPKPITCRQTWAKVCRDKEKVGTEAQSRRRRRSSPSGTAEVAPTPLPDPTPSPANASNDVDGFVLRLAGGPKTFTPEDSSDD